MSANTQARVRSLRGLLAVVIAGLLFGLLPPSAQAQIGPDTLKPPPAPQDKGQAPSTGQEKAKSPHLGKVIPETPAARAKLLDDLYAHLATAADEETAKPFMEAIERLWLVPGSDTVSVLMERAAAAVGQKRSDLALTLLSSVIDLAPDYAEAWNRRAYIFYTEGDYERALGDLRRVLALDANHFKALDGSAQILRELGFKRQALAAYQRLLTVHPFWPSAQAAIDELKSDIEGRGL